MPTPEQFARMEADARELDRTWRVPRGLFGWFRVATHQNLGKRYIITAFVFLLIGGIEAMLMRLQLAFPQNGFLNPDKYNEIFTTHGTTMMFLFAVPIMEGLGVYLVPLMVGTRNLAFPRLNAFGYYMFLLGGLFLYSGVLFNIAPDAGWFAYTPLSGPQFSPGKRVDYWAQMITFTEVSALSVALELVTTIFKLRAPGMSLNRMPLFVWSMLVQSFMVIFAMPSIMMATMMLLLDRTVGTHYFNPAEGGDPLLWQHLFWFFGHPEVYIIFIPALGFVSSIIAAFSRRHIFGYTAMVLSLIATGFIGFGLWVHHMFATGLPQLGESFFTAASMLIAIPSGVQIFCWIATLWGARLRIETPLLYVFGFIFIFVIGGMTGVMVASVPYDLQVHDTFFVVAHFHYVLIGGAVFPLLGALYFWFPKITGRMLHEPLGKITFWLLFVAFNVTFFPMHFLGLRGMPRRVYTYMPGLGLEGLNLLASIGAFFLALGFGMYVVNIVWSLRDGRIAGDNPWGAGTLEWATTSPPPSYNFVYQPVASGRQPIWDKPGDWPVVTGTRTDRWEVIATTLLDGAPDHRYHMPGPSVWPFLTAIAVTIGFVGSVYNAWWTVPGAILLTIGLIGWMWPKITGAQS